MSIRCVYLCGCVCVSSLYRAGFFALVGDFLETWGIVLWGLYIHILYIYIYTYSIM